MLIPISWLKDFVDIKLPLKDLMWKMTEAGLTCESYQKVGDEIILDVEVTANRPDWMSIIGVAREVAAIQNTTFKAPKIRELPQKQKYLPMDLKIDYEVLQRWSAVTIAGVTVKPSPTWLQNRLKLVGLRPINNIVDITNYVMFELGIPMHAFDYDEIMGQIMIVEKAKGGEEFMSVDELSYKLPKDAMIIKDAERIIDLCGIKGGFNSGIKATTKNLLVHSTIDNPVLTRRSSIALGLRSDASAIYERGPDKGGTVQTVKRMANLILELAGGEIASPLTDIKKEKFEPWKLKLSLDKLEKVLGIRIPDREVINILTKLNLSPKKSANSVECLIPTYRGDIKIEEDLVEEVARIYGYNKFPTTLPSGHIAKTKIPYYFDDTFILKLKNFMVSSGFSEVMTLSLLSADTLKKFEIKNESCVKITNPVSSEYEFMRPSLIPSLSFARELNPNETIKIFEVDKVYPSEDYKLATFVKGQDFKSFKGTIDLILERLNINQYKIEFETNKNYFHKSIAGTIKMGEDVLCEFGELSSNIWSELRIGERSIYAFEFDIKNLQKYSQVKIFKDIPINPAQIEDITLSFPPKTRIGEVVNMIATTNQTISNVELKDTFGDSYTFRIWYQDPKKTLTNEEVEKIRKEIIASVKNKFGGTLKD